MKTKYGNGKYKSANFTGMENASRPTETETEVRLCNGRKRKYESAHFTRMVNASIENGSTSLQGRKRKYEKESI